MIYGPDTIQQTSSQRAHRHSNPQTELQFTNTAEALIWKQNHPDPIAAVHRQQIHLLRILLLVSLYKGMSAKLLV